MSKSAREKEREGKTSLGFNDISNIHAHAFCCFVLSFSAAQLATHAPARERGGQPGRGTRKRQVGGGKRRRKQPGKLSKQAKHNSLLVWVCKGVTYLILASEGHRGEAQQKGKPRAERAIEIKREKARSTKGRRKEESMRGEL